MLESASERLARARRPASRLARQASGGAARDASALAGEQRVPFTSGILIGIGETRARAHRGAAGAARSARRARPHPGNHHPEFPAEARNAHGRRAGAVARRASVDDRGRAAAVRAGDEHPGAAQSEPGRAAPPDRRRHQRLGRRVAGDARPRQPGGAVAASRGARARHQRGRQAAGRAAGDLSGLCPRRADAGSIRRCARRCCIASTPTAGRAPTTGRPGSSIAAVAGRCARRPSGRVAPLARLPRSWRAPRPAQRSAKPTSSACFARAATSSPPCARRPTSCGRPSTATSSPTSSPATSTTPTSAISTASSAPSPKAR